MTDAPSSRPAPGRFDRARLGGFALVGALALTGWVYLASLAAGDGHMPGLQGWSAGDLAAVFSMWAAMVLAMMLPTLAPAVRIESARGGRVGSLLAGYLAVWFAAAAVASLAQACLVVGGVLAPHMAPAAKPFAASVLVAAGLYQFSPLKRACLVRCRSPRPLPRTGRSARAALRLGAEEGLACLGCCWALMAAMFAAGLMNLSAMAFLGAIMALEKHISGLMWTYVLGGAFLLLGLGLASSVVLG